MLKKMVHEFKNSPVAHSLRYARGYTATAVHGFPANKLFLIGVTGTDGKTTTCNLIYHILKGAGVKVGLISTISAKIFDGEKEIEYDTGFHVTSPDSFNVQKYLKAMVDHGCTHAVMECTSHALVQNRYAGINFDIGVVTNITHEHLDYHKTMDKYVEAKALLFRQDRTVGLKEVNRQIAIINQDDKAWELFKPYTENCEVIGYGFNDFARFHIQNLTTTSSGISFLLERESDNGEIAQATVVTAPLFGEYNAQNVSAALTVAYYCKLPVEQAAQALRTFPQLSGRFEQFHTPFHSTVVVDFAHTPHALEEVVDLGRKLATGRVILVFGSAGLRDVDKRYLMGRVAGNLADISIITAEDPRTETVHDISTLIAKGIVEEGGEEYAVGDFKEMISQNRQEIFAEHYPVFVRIDDRGDAIETAVKMARDGDIVLVCGKGHEKSMCFGTEERPWSDQDTVRAAIAALENSH
jgi:UDP-N-acetylmuramoyl-L-alanyl-D-glutamate--2,6-diaminopimelate ligase